jgi:flagellar export protein FliJ
MTTLDRLQRLRDHDKRLARMDLAKAESAHSTQEQRLAEVGQRIHQARADLGPSDPAELAQYHAFRLRMEMLSRRERAFLEETQRQLDKRRDEVSSKARESEVVRLMREARDEEAGWEARRTEERELDEVRRDLWLRKAA